MLRRHLVVLALASLLAIALGAPALAQDGDRRTEHGGRISVEGGTTVAEDERVSDFLVSFDGRVQIDGVVGGDVYVADGDLILTGKTLDDVVVVSGDAIVTGRINGSLLVIGGRAILRDGGIVVDDVSSTDPPRIAESADVGGEIEDLDLDGIFGGVLFTLLAFLWLAMTVSSAVLGLLFILFMPGAAEAAAASGRRVGSAIASGVVVGVAGPVAVIVTVATLVGLPFALGLTGALIAIGELGYVTSALCLGRTMVKGSGKKSRIGAFFAGLGILRAAALIPVLGGVVWLGATVYGVGALVNAAWRAGHRSPSTEPPSPAAEPALPVGEPPASAPPAKDETSTEDTEPGQEPATTSTSTEATDDDD